LTDDDDEDDEVVMDMADVPTMNLVDDVVKAATQTTKDGDRTEWAVPTETKVDSMNHTKRRIEKQRKKVMQWKVTR